MKKEPKKGKLESLSSENKNCRAFARKKLEKRRVYCYIKINVVKINFIVVMMEVKCMAISYKNLWKLLIDRDMKKKDLQELAGISAASITKLGKNENVNTEIIAKICVALKCDVSDIMEIILDNCEMGDGTNEDYTK